MMRYPILYPGNWSNFQNLGVGYMRDAISSKIKEVRNGAFELTVVYPVTGILYPAIELNGFIRVKPNDIDDSHIFRIDEIEPDKSSGTIEITASSKTNDLNGAFIKHMKQVSATGQVVLDEMKQSTVEPCDYLFETDITLLENITWDNRNVLNCLSGSQGSFIDVYGGEILRTDDTIYIYRQRGKDRAVTIRSGKNLKGFKMNTSFVGKYTRIIPRLEYELEDPVIKPKDSNPAADNSETTSTDNSENKFEHYSPIVISDKEAGYPATAHRLTDWDMSQYKPITDYIAARNKELQNAKKASDKLVQDGGNSNAETLKIIKLRDEKKAQINAEMDKLSKNYFKSINPGCDTPNVKIDIDVVQLADSIEKGILFELEHIGLCDRVRVYIPDYKINLVLPVTTIEYDSLRRRVVKITVESLSGSGSKSLADSLKAEYKDLRAENERIKNQMSEEANKLRQQISKSADGRTNIYHGPDTPPGANFKTGDIWWKEMSGGQVEMWVWDGSKWVQKLYKGMGEDLDAQINSIKKDIEKSFERSDKENQAKIDSIIANANVSKQTIDEIRNQQLSNKAVVENVKDSLSNIRSEFKTSIDNAVKSTVSLTKDLNDEKLKLGNIISSVNNLRSTQESAVRDLRLAQASVEKNLKDVSVGHSTLLTSLRNTINEVRSSTSITIHNVSNDVKSQNNRLNQLSHDISSQISNLSSQMGQVNVVKASMQSIRDETTQTKKDIISRLERQEQTVSQSINETVTNLEGIKTTISSFWASDNNLLSDTETMLNEGVQYTGNDKYLETFNVLHIPVSAHQINNPCYVKKINSEIAEPKALILSFNASAAPDGTIGVKITDISEYDYETSSGTTGKAKPGEVVLIKSSSLGYTTRYWLRIYPKSSFTTQNTKVHIGINNVNRNEAFEYRIFKPALYLGNLNKEWSPSSGDVVSKQAIYQQTINQNLAQLTESVRDTNGRLVTVESLSRQTREGLETKVSSNDFNVLKGLVNQQGTTITQTKDAIRLLATKESIDTIKGIVDRHNAELIATNNKFGSYITSDTFNNLEGTVSRNQAKLEQTIKGLSSLATAENIDSLKNTVERESSRLTQTIDGLNVYATKESINSLKSTVDSHSENFVDMSEGFDNINALIKKESSRLTQTIDGLSVYATKESLNSIKGLIDRQSSELVATNNKFGSYITSDKFNTLEGTVSRNQSKLEQTIKGLSSLATAENIDNLKNTVERESSRLTQTINGLNAYATKDSFNQLTGIVNNTKAGLDITNNTIRTLATKESVNQLTGDIQSAKSKWEQTAEGFSLDISRLKGVNSNLIPADKWSTSGLSSNNDLARFGHRFKYEKIADSTLPSGYFYRITILALSNNRRYAGVIIEDLRHVCHTPNGQKGAFSIYARSNRDIVITNFGFENNMYAHNVALNSQWKMVTSTGIPRDSGGDAFVIFDPDRDYVVGQTFDIWGPTLVLGDVPIDPKDAFNSLSESKLETAKAEIKATTDRISAQVSTIDTSVKDNVNQLRSSIELTNSRFNTVVSRTDFNTATGRINNLESRQTQLDNRISQVVTETRVNDLINSKGFVTNSTLQSKLDQTSNSLTSRITEVTNQIPKTVSHRNLVSTSTTPNWTEYEVFNNTPTNACFGSWTIPWADQTGIFPGVKINLKIHVSVDEVRQNNNDRMRCILQTGEYRGNSNTWIWGSTSPFNHERVLSTGNNYYVIELSTVVTDQMYNGYGGMFMNFRVDGTSHFKAHTKGLIITTGDIPPKEWTMPIENLATTNRITEVIQSIDGVKTTVAGAQNSINQLNIKADSTNQRISSLDSNMNSKFNAVNDTISSHTRTLSDQNNRLSQVIQTADGLVNRVYSAPAVNLLSRGAWTFEGSWKGSGATWTMNRTSISDSDYQGSVLRFTHSGNDWNTFYVGVSEYGSIIRKYKDNKNPLTLSFYARANRELTFENMGGEPNLYSKGTIGTNWTLITRSASIVKGSYEALIFYGSKQEFKNGDWIELRGLTLSDGMSPADPSVYIDGSSEKVNAVETKVSQLAGSWAVQNLNRNGDIISQINANSDGNVRIAGNKVSITGTTYIEDSVIDNSKIRNLDVNKIYGMDGNFLKARIGYLDVDRISGMDASFLMARIGDAWIDKLRGKTIVAQNGGMSIDLNNSNINLYNSEAAIVRRKGTHTAFLHFNDVSSSSDGGAGSVYVGLGVTSSGDGVNSMSSGRFAGMRIFRGAHGYNHTATVDQAEIYGDQIYLKDTFDVSRGFEFEIAQLPVGKVINMNNVYTSIVSLWRCWLHANNVAFDFNNNDLRRAIINEYNDHGRNI